MEEVWCHRDPNASNTSVKHRNISIHCGDVRVKLMDKKSGANDRGTTMRFLTTRAESLRYTQVQVRSPKII